jgi:hypothetical protein
MIAPVHALRKYQEIASYTPPLPKWGVKTSNNTPHRLLERPTMHRIFTAIYMHQY